MHNKGAPLLQMFVKSYMLHELTLEIKDLSPYSFLYTDYYKHRHKYQILIVIFYPYF